MNNQWVQSANNFFLREVSQNVELLKPAVYKVESTPMGELYLSHMQDEYDFPYKIYNIETGFINRVIKTYNNTSGNLGILLNGIKGTGKTVTAKQICNKLQLPVILVTNPFDNIPSFINNIQQDVVIFVDEFEKLYSDRDHSVLTIMDGALDNGFRRVFLLTTNTLYINENLLQRPGRIRYLKTYDHLSIESITEIVDDKLVHTHLRSQTIDFIAQLNTITVDIVKAVVDEVNIHEEDPKVFKDVFNIKMMDSKYNVYEIIPGQEQPALVAANTSIYPTHFEKVHVDDGTYFRIDIDKYDEKGMGRIINVVNDNTVVVESTKWDIKTDEEISEIKHYYVEEVKQYHYGYPF